MKIGILGAGMIGGTVGRLWAEAGHGWLSALFLCSFPLPRPMVIV
ncbi:hypothetical protein ACVDG8_003905 [Mesorhizobium sp. ORM8.1]